MWTYLPGMFVNRIAVFIIEHFWLNGIKITNPASYALHNVYVVMSPHDYVLCALDAFHYPEKATGNLAALQPSEKIE